VKLKDEESVIESELREDFNPILSLPPKKEAGEVFPTIWYRSTFAVTGMQHLKIAQMILLAESPSIGFIFPSPVLHIVLTRAGTNDPSRQQLDMRTALRNTEGQVRTIVLDLCGIALNHPETPPALLNATLAIHLYGDYFTDSYERKALKGVLRRLKDTCAWPVPEALKAFN
jgi:hypothetical protein